MPGQRKAPSLDRVVPLHENTLAVLEEGLSDCVERVLAMLRPSPA